MEEPPEGLPGGDDLEGLDDPGHGLVLQAGVLALRLLPGQGGVRGYRGQYTPLD